MHKIIRIDIEHPLYQDERELRNRVLLRPIGIPDFGWEMHDSESWHFVAVFESKIVGCVLLVPMDKHGQKSQLIQMAVDETWQGKGLGKQLVVTLIEFAKSKGLSSIEIHSRVDVTSFYENLGFRIYGENFEEVGVQHQHLRMKLSN